MLNLSTYALMACLAGWAGTTLFNSITHKIEIGRVTKATKQDTELAERKACTVSINAVEQKYNEYADGSVAAGAEAAAGVPPVLPEERVKRCPLSRFCRQTTGE